MAPLAVNTDAFVTVSYALFDPKGKLIERTAPDEPLTYVHGYSQILPGLESGLAGLAAGDKRSFTVPPEEAFGDRDEDAVIELDKRDFPKGRKLAVGDELVAEGPDGDELAMRVVSIKKDSVVVDTNHPLAGLTVRFDVVVDAVRAATADEIAEAQAELEEQLEEGCGCGEEHDHEHEHAPEPQGLVQLGRKAQA